MNKLKCVECGLLSPITASACIRCGTTLLQKGPTASLSAGPLVARLRSSPVRFIALVVAGLVLAIGAFKFAPGLISAPGETTNADPNTAWTTMHLPDPKKFSGLDPNTRDAAYWKVPSADLSKLADEYRVKWAASQSTPYLISPEEKVSRPAAMIGTPNQVNVDYTIPAKYGHCEGKAENIAVLDHFYRREAESVVLTVRFEADVFKPGAARYPHECGEPVFAGRKFTDIEYVWRDPAIGWTGWRPMAEAMADPNFQNAELKPDTLKKGIEEMKKFERELSEKEAEQNRRKELRRQARGM